MNVSSDTSMDPGHQQADIQMVPLDTSPDRPGGDTVPQLQVVSQDGLYQTHVLYEKFSRPTCYCTPPEPGAVCCGPKWWLQRAVGVQWISRERIVKSYFLPSWAVLSIRTVAMIYSTIIVLTGVITEWDDGYWFAFYTNLAYVGLAVYFWVGFLQL